MSSSSTPCTWSLVVVNESPLDPVVVDIADALAATVVVSVAVSTAVVVIMTVVVMPPTVTVPGWPVSCCMLLALAVIKSPSSEYVWKEPRVPDFASTLSGGPVFTTAVPAPRLLVPPPAAVDAVDPRAALEPVGPPKGTDRTTIPATSSARITITIAKFSPTLLELMGGRRGRRCDEGLSERSDKSIYRQTGASAHRSCGGFSV